MSDPADAILTAARAQRNRPSRALWIVALIVGGVCAIGFAILMFAEGSPSTTPKPQSTDHDLGFPIGLIVGGVVGIGVGFAIARRRDQRSESAESHSERNNP